MQKHVFIALTNCVDGGNEEEFNDWYTNVHARDILKVPGFVKATRYKLSSAQVMDEHRITHRYLAIYEVESDDIEATLKGLPQNLEELAIAGWQGNENLDVMGAISLMFTPIASISSEPD